MRKSLYNTFLKVNTGYGYRAVTNFSSKRGIVQSSRGIKKCGATAVGCCWGGGGVEGVLWRLRV